MRWFETRSNPGEGCGINVALSSGVFSFAAPWTSNPFDDPAVIATASVNAGIQQRPVRRWVKTHLMALNQQPYATASGCAAVLNQTPGTDLGENLQRLFDKTG